MTSDSRIGTDLAGYRIEAKVGQGGMGVVYRAEQTRLGRKVALKVLTPELAENAGFRERFEHESRLAAAIDHPNIVPLYEAGESDGVLFITMRYVEGTDLKALIERSRRLPPDRALAIAAQVASALDTAHARGLVHRDVKPGNVLVAEGAGSDGHDHCYLTDFGLTKDTASPVELTATGTFVGTLDYVAPEQIEGTAPDGRSDQYSLCCVLWECLVGTPPFVRDTEIAVMWAQLQDAPPRITEALPGMPPGLDDIIAKGLAKAPDARYATCAELVAAARAQVAKAAPRSTETAVRASPAASVPTAAHGAPETSPAAAARPGAAAITPASPAPPRSAPTTAPAAAVPPGAAPGLPAAAPAPAPATPAAAPGEPAFAGDATGPAGPGEAHVRPRIRPFAIIAVCVAVVLAAVGGALAGGSGDDAEPAPAVRAGTLSLSPAGDWRPGDDAAPVPGLRIDAPASLAGGSASLTAGRLADPGAALLPDALVARLPGRASPRGEGVALGSIQALRFAGLRVRGVADALTIYVVPTGAGALALTCRAPDPATLARSGCESVVATLRLRDEQPLDLAPGAEYAGGLREILQTLRASRERGRGDLARARTSRAQLRAADTLSGTYGRLERRARQLKTPPVARRASDAIVAALRDGRRAYGRLAAAAGQQSASGYAAATREVARAEARLERAVGALAALGYQVAR